MSITRHGSVHERPSDRKTSDLADGAAHPAEKHPGAQAGAAERPALSRPAASPDALAPAREVDAEHLATLHRRLAELADAEDLLDVAYRTVDSPLGRLLLAATPVGLVRVAFEDEGEEAVLATLGERISPRILRDPRRLESVARQLEEYFSGRRHDFDVTLDLRLTAGFRREVLAHLREIPYGATASYTALAAAAGRPTAVRAAASACATNPVPLVVPCHRVVRSDGSLGGYRGGLPAKRVLLDLERAA
ncbi:methylated-DNA--[protein]-cysteine S-methyltransferase [Georgenia sp. M64]|uniref:methylated-DNA--[protein]-cysteine S-methyltransferase n=1 Tax=Georgenia sp. M64 TaxID=3120520 RepID=UPI0030E3605F